MRGVSRISFPNPVKPYRLISLISDTESIAIIPEDQLWHNQQTLIMDRSAFLCPPRFLVFSGGSTLPISDGNGLG